MADPTYIGVPLPEYERRVESPSTDTSGGTTKTPWSPEQRAVEAERDALLTGAEADVNAERTAADKRTAIEKRNADELAAEKVRQGDLDAAAAAESQKTIAAARARVEAKQKEFDNYKPQNFFHSGSTWGNALRGMALGLGDAIQKRAAVAGGHAAPNVDTVGDIIANDLKQSEMQIARLKDQQAMAHTGLADANEARAQMMADRHQAAATAYDRLISVGNARLASLGYDNNQIRANKEMQALKEKRAEERGKVADFHADKVESHWAHKGPQTSETFRNPSTVAKPTERQSTDAFLGKNLSRALDTVEKNGPLPPEVLDQLQSQELGMAATDKTASSGILGNAGAAASRALGFSPKSKTEGMLPAHQETVTAFDVAKEMVARKLSGGAITTDEDRQNAEKYMPHAGDSPELKAHKVQVLRDMAKDMLKLAGPAGESLGGAAAAPTAPSPAPTQPPPFKPQTAPVPSAPNPRDQAIQLLRSGKVSPGLIEITKRRFNITPQELQQ